MRHLALGFALVASLAACSGPSRLAPDAKAFALSISGVKDAVDAVPRDLRADLVSQRTAVAVAAGGAINIPAYCASSRSRDASGALFPPCIATAASDKEPIDAGVLQEAPAKQKQIAALADYAAGVAVVTDASDSKALSDGTDKLAAAALALATATGQPEAALVPVAIGLVGTAARLALEAERMSVLRRTVGDERVRKAVATVSTGLGTYLSAARDERLSVRNDEDRFRGEEVASLRGAARSAPIAAIQDRLAATDAIRVSDPSAAATAVVKAHDALGKAAEDPAANLAVFSQAVGELADAVKKLRAASAPAATGKGA